MCPVMNSIARSFGYLLVQIDFVAGKNGDTRRVAYASQFPDPDNRAHHGKAKIKAKLIGDRDPDEWELPQSLNGCDGAHTTAVLTASTLTKRYWVVASTSSFAKFFRK